MEGTGWVTERLNTIEVVEVAEDGSTTRRPLPAPSTELATNDQGPVHYLSVAVSPDGTQVLAAASRNEDGNLLGHQEIHLLPTSPDLRSTIVCADAPWTAPGWLADGSAVATLPRKKNALSLSRIVRLNLDSSEANLSPEPICDEGVQRFHPGSTSRGRWSNAATLFCMANHGASVTVDHIDLASGTARTVAGDGQSVVGAFDVGDDGARILASISSPVRPAELWEFRDGSAVCLVSLNESLLNELELAPVDIVQVESTDGASVEAFVFRPPASVPGNGPRPGLIYIHGGPTAAYTHTFFDEFQIAAAAGYVVIAGNPRGSDGYGDVWAEVLQGKIGTVDYDDIMAMTDHLESLPDVDATQIGIGGGSYGGLMTAWMIGHTDRYQAALVERCVSNMESFAGTSDIGGFFTLMLNGTTVELDQTELRRQSPLSYAANVTTPVLLIHSDSDYRCPLEQGQQLFSAYRRNGVDASMVIFPGENHELSRSGTPKHRMERFGFIHDFYAGHLGGHTVQSDWNS